MASVFISYRREDNPDAAGRIYDRLKDHFGDESVFFDIDTVPFGLDFRKHVDTVVSKCDILLVVIGDKWLTVDDQGQPRLEDPADFVRIEIEAALKRDIPVVPVPVGNASIPRINELPEAISNLSYRNAAEVRSGTAFQGHIERLIHGIESILAAKPEPESVREPEPEQEPEPEKERQPAEAERRAEERDRKPHADAVEQPAASTTTSGKTQETGITSRDRVIGALAGAAIGTVLGVLAIWPVGGGVSPLGLLLGAGGGIAGAVSGLHRRIIVAAAIGAATGWVVFSFVLLIFGLGPGSESFAAGGVFGAPVGIIVGAIVGVILEKRRSQL